MEINDDDALDTFRKASNWAMRQEFDYPVLRLVAEHPPFIVRIGSPEEFNPLTTEDETGWLDNGWVLVEETPKT